MDPSRQRSVDWEDPQAVLARLATMPGLEYLRGLENGTIPAPPMARLLGFTLEHVADGTVTMAMPIGEWTLNPITRVHGGILTVLLDTVMGCSVHSKLAAGERYTTTDLHTHFVRGVTLASPSVRAVGKVVHFGRRTATASAELFDARERLCAHASSTLLLLGADAAEG